MAAERKVAKALRVSDEAHAAVVAAARAAGRPAGELASELLLGGLEQAGARASSTPARARDHQRTAPRARRQRATASSSGQPTGRAEPVGPCPHPIGRKIGDGCGACGNPRAHSRK